MIVSKLKRSSSLFFWSARLTVCEVVGCVVLGSLSVSILRIKNSAEIVASVKQNWLASGNGGQRITGHTTEVAHEYEHGC